MGNKVLESAELQKWSQEYLADVLRMPASKIDPTIEFDSLGLDSSVAVAYILSLEELADVELMPELLFDYSTIELLCSHVESLLQEGAAS